MLVLGLETSCDETAAAVLRDGRQVLADVVSTQVDIHHRFGGVVPEIASRNHLLQVLPVVHEALTRANVGLRDIDAYAVTSGPGLLGALLVGLQVAKSFALAFGKPLVGINHLEGHVLAATLGEVPVHAPFVALVVSGGHTTLYDVPEFGRYERLGTTRDDAAGEAFDKVGKLLGLPYPAGAPIDRLAATGDATAIRFPRALNVPDVWDFSFSGLKTSVSQWVETHGCPEGQGLADLCASFQEAIADSLTRKLVGMAKRQKRDRVVICGGVASNSRLRALALERGGEAGLQVIVPRASLCTDNGAMIAAAGYHALVRGAASPLQLDAAPSWRL